MAVALLLIIVVTCVIALHYRKGIARHFKNRLMLSRLPSLPDPAYPLIGHAYLLRGDPSRFFEFVTETTNAMVTEVNEKIGILWLGPVPLMVVCHPEAAEVVLRSSKHMEKSYLYKFLHPWLGTGLLTSGGEKWKQRRRLITPSFHFNILQDFLEVMNEESGKLINNLKKKLKSGVKVDVGKAVTMCALDIICETAMGQTVNAQENDDSSYVRALYRISELIQLRQKTPTLWWDPAFSRMKLGKEHENLLSILHGFTRDVITKRAKTRDQKIVENPRRMAFLDVLLHAETEDGKTLSLNDIQEEVDTFMFEGHDTTAAAMTWAIYVIGRHPDIQKKIHEELDAVFGEDRGGTITNNQLQKLSYLERVIKECLRLYPSVPFYARVLSEDCKVGDYMVPKGTQTVIFAHTIHHHPYVWEDPEKFDPDRFLAENCVKRHPYAYIPFSAGPRNCIGQKFALMEEKVILSKLLHNYFVVSHDKKEDLVINGDLILRSSTPLNITLEARK
uniref:Cytochrome P450 4V2 n=1 Tax=Ciona intestinalis TaxID=7719 RepID=F6RS86_CIOIN|nr:cytochrome P450 4V2 [Ciona intestinalis]|eukprot:XP_002123140.1 cytochrome P450 4V2 [Ciona intestinalis]